MTKKINNYIEVFPEIFDEFKNKNNKKISKYKANGLPKGYMAYYHGLEDSFKTIGIGEMILNKDEIEAKKNFYLSAFMRKVIIERSDISKYYEENFAYTYCEENSAIYLALLSGNNNLVNDLIKLSGSKNDNDEIKEVDEIFVSNRLYSIKYIILNKYYEAKSCVNKIHNIANEKYMKPFLNYEEIFTSILVKDEEMLNKALNNLCKNNSKLKYYKDTPEGLICIEGLGLAKLAISKGMNVKLDASVQGREILEMSEFEYPIVDFVD